MDRATFRQTYSVARLRGVNAAYMNSFWRDEVGKVADELLTLASQGDGVDQHAQSESGDLLRQWFPEPLPCEPETTGLRRNSPWRVRSISGNSGVIVTWGTYLF